MAAAQVPDSKTAARETYSAQRSTDTEGMTAPQSEGPVSAYAPISSRRPTAQTSVEASESARSAATVASTEAARRLLEQGRRSLREGTLELATRCAEAAQARKPDLAYWEDNPERLKRDIQRAAAAKNASSDKSGEVGLVSRKTPAAAPAGVPAAESSKRKTPESQQEANAMLKEGRKLLAAGKFDEAASIVAAVQGFQGHYGLFDDTPERLVTDIHKARTEQDRVESAKALKEGRRAFESGDLDKATTLAYRAQQLHGPYYLWELGDRPNKLLADIQAERNRRPAGKSSAVVKQPNDRGTGVADRQPVEGNADIRLVSQQSSPAKERAQQLLAEAQGLQRQGQFLEARQKALQAQAQRVPFGVEELSPERLLLQLASQVRQQTDRMVQQAIDVAQYGQGEPRANYQWAEQQLQAAHRLAEGFG